MWRPIRKHFKVAFVWGVICLLTFDTATACRFLSRRRACRCECVVICEPVCGSVISDCTSGKVTDGIKEPAAVDEIPTAPKPAEEPESPADRVPERKPEVVPMQDIPPAEAAKPAPAVEEPAPAPPAPAQPAPAEAAPAEPPPAQPAPAKPVDDLFGDAPKAEPAPAAPAEAAPAQPQPAAVDDLFGDAPKPAAPAGPQPNAPAPAPAAPAPAPAKPVDDLFGDAPAAAAPAPANAEPAVPAAKTVDDLFGEPAAKPAEQPAPAPAPKNDAVDDLFGGETKPAEPANNAPPANEPKKPADDPFGANVKSTNELLVMRKWVDNTGTFTVHGRLIEILDGKVRLLKDNGHTCTVPMRRLSVVDAQYVQLVASKLGTGTLVQLASR